MPTPVTLEEAKARLAELIDNLIPGEELVITRDGKPVATPRPGKRTSWPCQPGSAQDKGHWMAPDFDALLDDFKNSMC